MYIWWGKLRKQYAYRWATRELFLPRGRDGIEPAVLKSIASVLLMGYEIYVVNISEKFVALERDLII